MRVERQQVRAGAWGAVSTGILALLIVVGSRNLDHFDAALVGYTFATLFATFGITYRYAMWLERPPTRLYWRRGWQVFATHDCSDRILLSFVVSASSSRPIVSSSGAPGCGAWRTG